MSNYRLIALLLLAGCEQAPDQELHSVVEQYRQKMKDGCGIAIERPDIIVRTSTNGSHGGADCVRKQVWVPASALKNDRAFVNQSLIPHEVAHLGHCAKYKTSGHKPEFWVIEEYLRGVTETCAQTRGLKIEASR